MITATGVFLLVAGWVVAKLTEPRNFWQDGPWYFTGAVFVFLMGAALMFIGVVVFLSRHMP